MSETVKATAWRWRSARRTPALVDVGDHVGRATACAAPTASGAPGEAGAVDALGVDRRVAVAEQRVRRDLDALEEEAAGGGGAQAHRRLGLDEQAGASPASTMNSAGPCPRAAAATTNSSASAARGDERLGRRRGRSRSPSRAPSSAASSGSNSGCGSRIASAAAGHVVAGEGRQVRRLLVGVAPQAERGGDRRRGEQRRRRGPCRRGRAPRRPGRWSRRSARRRRRRAPPGRRASRAPSSAACAEQLRRRGARGRRRPARPGAARSAAKSRTASMDHLLLVVGREVEERAALRRRRARGGLADAA